MVPGIPPGSPIAGVSFPVRPRNRYWNLDLRALYAGFEENPLPSRMYEIQNRRRRLKEGIHRIRMYSFFQRTVSFFQQILLKTLTLSKPRIQSFLRRKRLSILKVERKIQKNEKSDSDLLHMNQIVRPFSQIIQCGTGARFGHHVTVVSVQSIVHGKRRYEKYLRI